MDRTYPAENEATVEVERQKFLQQRCSPDTPSMTAADGAHSLSMNDTPVQFVPRSASEKPRNAVAIDDSSKRLIRMTVLTEILSRATDLVTLKNKTWNKGGAHFCFVFFSKTLQYLKYICCQFEML